MKHLLILAVLMCAVAAYALPEEAPDPQKMLDVQIADNGILSFEMTNYGKINQIVYQNQHKLVYSSTPWISGKRNRRDSLGRLLYWTQYPPTNTTPIIYEGHETWTPELIVVQDTLTTVGFDGDRDLYELLPAYNPLLEIYPDLAAMYELYNDSDRVLESVAGEPAPLPYDPQNSTSFCFSIPQPGSFETPGFLTYSSYYYDYCPFGTDRDRDWGRSRMTSTHYPLGIAIHQESYCWPVQDHDWMFVNKYNLINMNQEDTINDIALSHYVDADLGPINWGYDMASDDVSGYVKGEGYEFAYTRDYDGDGGLSPYYVASKVIVPNFPFKAHAWYWRVGNGPDDRDSRNLSPAIITANQKYWLATGRNPDTSKYTPLRPESPEQMQYEQPQPHDTRFLHCLYGAQPNTDEYMEVDAWGNYFKRLYLAPGQSMVYYNVLFIGDSLDDLKAKSLAIEEFIGNGLIIDVSIGYTSIPYLRDPVNQAPDTFMLRWHNATAPAEYELSWKEYGAPASEWNVIPLPANTSSYNLQGMNPDSWYEIKIGAIFYNPQEVYLESETKLVSLSYSDVEDEAQVPLARLSNYPNPFSESTIVEFEIKMAEKQELKIYNLKGQLVRSLDAFFAGPGKHQILWDGKDASGKTCASGIYYLRMQSGESVQTRKMLILK